MARSRFGGTDDDRVELVWQFSRRNIPTLADEAPIRFYDALEGGTEYTDFSEDAEGTIPVTVTTDEDGYIPAFYGPDGVTELWAQAQGPNGPARRRFLMVPQGRQGPPGPKGDAGPAGAPGGSDEAFADWIDDPESQTRAKLTATQAAAAQAAVDAVQPLSTAAPGDVGQRAGAFDPTRSLYLPSGVTLDAVRAKFAAGSAGVTRVKVAWIGTSIVAGYGSAIGVNSPPVMLRKYLSGRYGDVGSGLVPSSSGVHNNNAPVTDMDDNRYSFTGAWTNPGAPRGEDMQFHLTSGAPPASITFTSTIAGTVADIYYFNNSRPFTYSIDGGAAVTVTPTGGTTIGVTTVTDLPDDTHTIKVTVAGSSGQLFLLGMGIRHESGIEIAGLGYYGSITADWLPASIGGAFYNGHNVVLGYAPDVALVQLGPNELIHSISGGAATVKANLSTIIAAYKTAGIKPVLVVDPPIESGTVSGWATTYRSSIYDVADTQAVPLIDLTDAWRNRAAAAALGYYFDQWHPAPAGSASMAEVVYAALAR